MEVQYSTKGQALSEIFDIENFRKTWPFKSFSVDKVLEVLSKDSYNLKIDLASTHNTISKLTKFLAPNRARTTSKVCTYLLFKYGLKQCVSCKQIYLFEDFYSNNSKTYGKDCYCNSCFNILVKDYRREYVAAQRALKSNRVPSWANLDKIKEIYANCPTGSHVDHWAPLNGILVCGLHVEHNLQYLPAEENIRKSNKFTPG